MRVVVVNHLTLDGVLQGPGRPDEDTRHGFRHGGWAQQAAEDPAIGTAIGDRMGQEFYWLFGRRSYEDMLGHWNKVGGPFKDGLNQRLKYVASSNPDTDLPWPNSRLLSGDIPAAVAALREQPGGNLVIMGSGQLIRSLLPRGLVDELFLMIHPIVLGSGQRLFGPADERMSLTLVDSAATSTGVTLTTYRRRRPFLSLALRWLIARSRLRMPRARTPASSHAAISALEDAPPFPRQPPCHSATAAAYAVPVDAAVSRRRVAATYDVRSGSPVRETCRVGRALFGAAPPCPPHVREVAS